MPLPTQVTRARENISDLSILLYGIPKIGKTTLAAQANDPVILASEDGTRHLDCYTMPIRSWTEFLEACAELSAGRHRFKTVVLDTIDNIYRWCVEHVCATHGVNHEGDLKFGKGYEYINREFHRVLTKLSLLPYGLILISHEQEKEVEENGKTITKTIPTLPRGARKVVLGLVDVIGYCEVERGGSGEELRRVMRTKPTLRYEAGDRTGRLPETIELSYAALKHAFEESRRQPE